RPPPAPRRPPPRKPHRHPPTRQPPAFRDDRSAPPILRPPAHTAPLLRHSSFAQSRQAPAPMPRQTRAAGRPLPPAIVRTCLPASLESAENMMQSIPSPEATSDSTPFAPATPPRRRRRAL